MHFSSALPYSYMNTGVQDFKTVLVTTSFCKLTWRPAFVRMSHFHGVQPFPFHSRISKSVVATFPWHFASLVQDTFLTVHCEPLTVISTQRLVELKYKFKNTIFTMIFYFLCWTVQKHAKNFKSILKWMHSWQVVWQLGKSNVQWFTSNQIKWLLLWEIWI